MLGRVGAHGVNKPSFAFESRVAGRNNPSLAARFISCSNEVGCKERCRSYDNDLRYMSPRGMTPMGIDLVPGGRFIRNAPIVGKLHSRTCVLEIETVLPGDSCAYG